MLRFLPMFMAASARDVIMTPWARDAIMTASAKDAIKTASVRDAIKTASGRDAIKTASARDANSASKETRWLQWNKLDKGRCLDGSPMGIYTEYQTDDSMNRMKENGIFVYFEGGGWCYGKTEEETIEDCYQRSKGRLGSSKGYQPWIKQDWYQAGVAEPYYHIYVPYCDGTSFTGNATKYSTPHDTTVYFEGHLGLMEIIKELKTRFLSSPGATTKKNLVNNNPEVTPEPESLDPTYSVIDVEKTADSGEVTLVQSLKEDVPARTFVISGGSAGASTVFFHIDKIAAMIREVSPNSTVIGAPDSGFFLDVPSCWGEHPWTDTFYQMGVTANSFPNLHDKCRQKFEEKEWWKCLYQQNYAELIDTKLIILQSLFDASEIGSTLDVYCNIDEECPWDARTQFSFMSSMNMTSMPMMPSQPSKAGKCCSSWEMKCVHNLRDQHLLAMIPILQNPKHGHFLLSCVKHCILGLPVTAKTTIGEVTVEEAVHSFVKGESVKMLDYRDWAMASKSKQCLDKGPYEVAHNWGHETSSVPQLDKTDDLTEVWE